VLTPGRALTLNIESGTPLPRVPALDALYNAGTTPRHGEVVMIAGRSGSQKSGFALWWVQQMGLPTLYFSADMSAFTASARIASTMAGLTTEEVEVVMRVDGEEKRELLHLMATSKVKFSFGSPITWWQIDDELNMWVEAFDSWPAVIVIDNLMDVDGAEADYAMQMEAMQRFTELARETGATVIVLHHATDKGHDASVDPYNPPARRDIKNGLGEKPELCLGVAIDPYTNLFKIATLKQRMGKSDLTGKTFIRLQAEPAKTRFHKVGTITKGE
jgi:KaiC/GvpD/RAD55 family RecA-like ATPase